MLTLESLIAVLSFGLTCFGLGYTLGNKSRIRTTGLAGGLFTPYKGSLPAFESKDSSNRPPAA